MNGIRNNAHSSLPYQNRLYNLQYEITFVSYLLRIQNSNINTSGLKCLATLILFFGNVLLRQSIDLDSRSRAAVGASATLSATFIIFPI